jgi:hypothetical protein
MRFFHRLFSVAIIAVSIASPVAWGQERTAPDAETLAAARELFAVTFERVGTRINTQAVDSAWPGIEIALKTNNPALDRATLAALHDDFARIRLEKLRALMSDAPVIYARHLHADDMRALVEFYRGPAGTRVLVAMPDIVTELFASLLPGMPAVVGETQEEFQRLARTRGYIK